MVGMVRRELILDFRDASFLWKVMYQQILSATIVLIVPLALLGLYRKILQVIHVNIISK